MKATDISSLVDIAEKDFEARFPKYPDQTKFVLRDTRVIDAIRSRFDKNQSLLSIKALPYNFTTGLQFICFDFGPEGKAIGPDSLLVIANGDCNVVSVIDDFDSRQPNPWVPPLPEKSDIETDVTPFALARPSGLDKMHIRTDDLVPMEVRSTAFFARLGGMGGVFGRGAFGVDDGAGGSATSCTYVSFTMWEGPFPGMGDRVFPRPIYDTSLDDCGPA
jgi:hypothetical protein